MISMCDYDCVDFEFEGCPLEAITIMRELDQFPSLQLGHLIIKMNLEIVYFNFQIPFNPSHNTNEQSDQFKGSVFTCNRGHLNSSSDSSYGASSSHPHGTPYGLPNGTPYGTPVKNRICSFCNGCFIHSTQLKHF
jgi:hypothetical protein